MFLHIFVKQNLMMRKVLTICLNKTKKIKNIFSKTLGVEIIVKSL